MMRVQCCICSDLFENDIDIAVVRCGHTFHTDCLMKWLDNTSSCPHCRVKINRNQVIKKVYFDLADDFEETEDNSEKLVNNVRDLKLKLSYKDKEITEVEETKNRLVQQVADVTECKDKISQMLKQEESTNSALRKQLAYFEAQQKAMKHERDECKRIKQDMVDVKNVQILLSGCESETEFLLDQYGSGVSRPLARYCSILKTEYEQSKTEKRQLKDENDRYKKELISKSKVLSERTKQLSAITEQFRQSEEELKALEREKAALNRRVRHLKQSRTSTANSESPVVESFKIIPDAESTPVRLSKPLDNSDIISLDDTPTHLVRTPEMVGPSPTTTIKNSCKENNVKYVKISTAADEPPSKKQKCEPKDLHLNAMGSLNIFKKKSGVSDYASCTRKGYNGLGGHMTFSKSMGGSRSLSLSKKPANSGPKLTLNHLGFQKTPHMIDLS